MTTTQEVETSEFCDAAADLMKGQGEVSDASLRRLLRAADALPKVSYLVVPVMSAMRQMRQFVVDMNERNKERNAKIAALESLTVSLAERVAALENQKGASGVRWAGTYSPGQQYESGELVTRGGGLWLCLRDGVTVQPGTAPDRWRLICKEGRAHD